MITSMKDIIDSILDQEVELAGQGFRPGFILAGREQYQLLLDAMKKECLHSTFPRVDVNLMLAGYTIVPDIFSKDRLNVVPEASLRTDSILRRGDKRNG